MARPGDLERRILHILWAARPDGLTVREVADHLSELAYTTVLTVLDRLHGKGLVEREREGKAYRYTATNSREDHAAGLMREVLGQAGDRDAVLVRFAATMSPDEAAVLAQALDDLGVAKGLGVQPGKKRRIR